MASLFSHPVIPVALRLSSSGPVSKKLFYLCVVLTCLPDLDVIGFRFGIPYASPWGHRGFTHSIVFAFFLGLLFCVFSSFFAESRKKVFWWTFVSTLSHTILDAMTNGGLGVAAFWPLTNERFFLPWTPVEVSPIGVRGFLTLRGLEVLLSEVLWLWLPAVMVGYFLRWRKKVSE